MDNLVKVLVYLSHHFDLALFNCLSELISLVDQKLSALAKSIQVLHNLGSVFLKDVY